MPESRRGLKQRYRQWRQGWPEKFNQRNVRFAAWMEAMFLDHGILRPLWNTPKPVNELVWRGNQPGGRQIQKLARRGIRTIVSLRGLNRNGAALFEMEACRQAGLTLIPFKMSSRGAPKAQTILDFADLLAEIETPVLFHCKSGADRAGFAAALYLLLTGEGNIDEARAQLSWRYLHFKGAKTGRLDAFLEAYQSAQEHRGIDFLTWVREQYNPDEVNRNFEPKGWSTWLVDKVLRRE